MVAAISMVKDEADVVERTVRHMLGQVDLVIVADNGSTDGTYELLQGIRHRNLIVLRDDEVGYYQSQKMTALAVEAAELYAAWVVPFDADEVWYSPHGRIGTILDALPASVATAPARLFDHVPTANDPGGHPFDAIGWRRPDPAPLPKVAARTRLPVTIEQGNHAATFATETADPDLLVVRHYPYRSAEQMVRKACNGAAAYAATDLPEHEGQHWRDYGRIVAEKGEEALHTVFREWFWSADPAGDGLVFDPCPV